MRTRPSRVLLGTALAIVAAAACGYDPNPESGTLLCGPMNSCPQSYSCMNGACWRDGAGGSTGSTALLLGHWASNPNVTTRVRVCTDTTNETVFWDDFLDILPGTASALTTNYYCDWNLDVNAGGTATTIRPAQTCTHPAAGDPTTMFTWHGMTLTLTTTNGTSGTLDMSLPYEYTTTTGSGSCTMHFTGPMNKQ
jgi:hypothetical protein